jgi:hypothetical protein
VGFPAFIVFHVPFSFKVLLNGIFGREAFTFISAHFSEILIQVPANIVVVAVVLDFTFNKLLREENRPVVGIEPTVNSHVEFGLPVVPIELMVVPFLPFRVTIVIISVIDTSLKSIAFFF